MGIISLLIMKNALFQIFLLEGKQLLCFQYTFLVMCFRVLPLDSTSILCILSLNDTINGGAAKHVFVIPPILFFYCCPVKVFLMIKIRLKPSCRISASFVTLLVGKKTLVT